MSKFSDELQAKALKLILLNQFVEVDVEKLKNDAHVISKNKIIEPRERKVKTEIIVG